MEKVVKWKNYDKQCSLKDKYDQYFIVYSKNEKYHSSKSTRNSTQLTSYHSLTAQIT